MREEATRTLRGLGTQLVSTAATVARLPGRIDEVIGRIERGDLEVKAPETEQLLRRLRRTLERVVSAIIFAVAMVFYHLGYLNVGRLSDLMGMSAGRLKL